MNRRDNHDPEREVRERIASLMQSIGAPRKPVAEEEFQRLKDAASRLDQLLKLTEDANRQALKTAAERLDQLLADISNGKEVTQGVKARRELQDRK